MRKLSVYYCRNCNRRTLSQSPGNPVCHKCGNSTLLPDVCNNKLIAFDPPQRELTSMKQTSRFFLPLPNRFKIPKKQRHPNELTEHMARQILEMRQEIHDLNDTINWMHSTLWEEFGKKEQLKEEVQRLKMIWKENESQF